MSKNTVEKPEPEKDEEGYRIITQKFACELCEYYGGYKYPHLNKNLYLHYYGFHKIENIDTFINLKILYLEGNRIEKIEALDNLESLTCLYLQNNYISKIEGLEKLAELVILNLSGNKIKKIENLGYNQKLSNFYIEKNNIQTADDIRGILECRGLTLFDIQTNKLDEEAFEIIDILSQVENLRVLYFKGNDAIRMITNYRRTMIVKLSQLTYLDDRPVQEEDRIAAKAFLEGGREAEIKARTEYRNKRDGINPEKLRERERNKEDYEARKKKALENLQRAYEQKKESLKEIKNDLLKQFEENPDKRNQLELELSLVDKQIEENEKYKDEEQDNLPIVLKTRKENLVKREGFAYEEWMDEIIENEVMDNYFDFSRALKLILLEFKKRDVKNYQAFKLIDLRSRWTEMELKKFRKYNDGTIYHYTKEDIFPEEQKKDNKDNKVNKENKDKKQVKDDLNAHRAFIKIKEGTIDEKDYNKKKQEEIIEEIDTSMPKKEKLDELD